MEPVTTLISIIIMINQFFHKLIEGFIYLSLAINDTRDHRTHY